MSFRGVSIKIVNIVLSVDNAVIGFGMAARSAVNKTDNLVFSEIPNDNNYLIVIRDCG